MIPQEIMETALRNTENAHQIIQKTGIIKLWESIGATVNPVGSLSMELLVKHLDIDLHLYTPTIEIGKDFSVMSRLAALPSIRKIEYGNLLATEERCLEWHAWYEADDGEIWQLDMIHIERGSRYDGYFERQARRIAAALTDETRNTILRLKWETPEEEKIAGIEYYQAVIRDGVRDYDSFMKWRMEHPLTGVVEWMP